MLFTRKLFIEESAVIWHKTTEFQKISFLSRVDWQFPSVCKWNDAAFKIKLPATLLILYLIKELPSNFVCKLNSDIIIISQIFDVTH